MPPLSDADLNWLTAMGGLLLFAALVWIGDIRDQRRERREREAHRTAAE
jgi:hypothetical protein